MEIIRPTIITDAMFISSNLTEDDHAEYAPGTTYVTGDKVIVVATHRIYESQVDTNVGNYPPDNLEAVDPAIAPWKEIGATNKWRVFDQVVGNQATHATVLEYELKPGMINSISLQNVDAVEATVTIVTDPIDGTIVYNKTIQLISTANVKDWYDYFFEPILFVDTCVEWNLPISPDATLTISINNGDSPVSCGEIVVGMEFDVGITQGQPSVSIHDYSVKTTDDAGAYTIEERSFSKEVSCDVRLENQYMDHVFSILAQYRATPTVWVVVDNYSSMIAYGFFTDFQIILPGGIYSFCAIDIEGLT
jgi:hypothetical protein